MHAGRAAIVGPRRAAAIGELLAQIHGVADAPRGLPAIDVVADFKPEDLATGVDTQIEAAAAIVLEP